VAGFAAVAGLRSPERLGRQLRLVCAGLMTSTVVSQDPGGESAAARVAARALVDAAG
jgi:hypothetical protein